MKILTAAEMKEVDRLTTERAGIRSSVLMDHAGGSVAQFIRQRFPNLARRLIFVFCGKGNNGGDGLVAALQLLGEGAKTEVILFADPNELRGEAADNLRRWENAPGELHVVRSSTEWSKWKSRIAECDILVDALLGTGARGAVEGLLRDAIESVNGREARCPVVAVDIPSGLHADTGEVQGAAIVADYTVTFTAPKVGMFQREAQRYLGELVVRDIGSPADLISEVGHGSLRWSEPGEFAQFAKRRKADGNKGDYGHALIVAGSVGKSGAAVLASWSALRTGAGLVTVATPEPVLPIVAAHTPEIMTEPLAATEAGTVSLRSLEYGKFEAILKGKRALGMGPGLTTQDETQQFIRKIVGKRNSIPLILDADGLNAFAGRAGELKNAEGMIAVTPHPGEMARLTGLKTDAVQARRLELALESAAAWNAYVILKGHTTIVAAPAGNAFINSTGNPGMGTGGTGDVLTGMLSALTAQFGTENWERVLAFGVYLHGLAGDIAYADFDEAPLMAGDLVRAIPRAYQRFYAACSRA
ncbi:MAG: NAD(P)H-hydrate dehydratase [Candidatus Acidiferrales bacterium]|jgi:NAD(P)H-hydrate epimerase